MGPKHAKRRVGGRVKPMKIRGLVCLTMLE